MGRSVLNFKTSVMSTRFYGIIIKKDLDLTFVCGW